MVNESLQVAELYENFQDWEKVREVALSENILKTRTHTTGIRYVRPIISRLSQLHKDEFDLFVDGSRSEQKQLLWIAICRCHRFIREFAMEVIREKFIIMDLELTYDDYDMFFNRKAEWHDELDQLSDSTRLKLRAVMFKLLKEADLLTNEGMIIPYILTPLLIRTVRKHSYDDLLVFPVNDADLVV
ncbi:DUF1819 family protein [bacterium]|nr:DUF1819 family protein [bacterium]